MRQFKQITLRVEAELYKNAQWKADKLGFPLATLIRVFLKSFTTQSGVGFYVGDHDLVKLINSWMFKKQLEKHAPRITVAGTRLKDIFELSETKRPENRGLTNRHF